MKYKIKSSLSAGALALCLLFSSGRESDLKDVAKPYLGVYRCTEARIGEKDLLEEFSNIRLELKEGEYILYYREKAGRSGKVEGKYRYDKERESLLLTENTSGVKREFPFANGKLTVAFPVGRRECVLQFERK